MFLGMGLYKSGFLKRPLAPGGVTKVVAIAIAAGVSVRTMVGCHPRSGCRRHWTRMCSMALPQFRWRWGIWDCSWRGTGGPRGCGSARAGLGQMALTNYLSQTVLCMALVAYLPSPAYAKFGLARYPLYLGTAVVRLEAWLNRYRMGPIEWLCAVPRIVNGHRCVGSYRIRRTHIFIAAPFTIGHGLSRHGAL